MAGTKWCGSGNIAENYEDLGEERDTDSCCREHDYCPDYIEAKGTKHGLTNTASYTRFSMIVLTFGIAYQGRGCCAGANLACMYYHMPRYYQYLGTVLNISSIIYVSSRDLIS